MAERLLEIKDLAVSFHTAGGKLPALQGISLHIDEGESLGIVGESGCGKSVTALSILQMTPGTGVIESGDILYRGRSLLGAPENRKLVRGNRISMIFQDPVNSLNPVLSVGVQISEVLETHQSMSRKQGMKRAVELLEQVGLPSASKRVKQYPHQFSGGMRQRVMIAMALACAPELLIADEPTTALDVTIQAQILDLIQELCRVNRMALLMITHDFGIIAQMAERVMVMYAGRIVEEGAVQEIFKAPGHPYSMGLLASMPYFANKNERLTAIRGSVHEGREWLSGCAFHPRCDFSMPVCLQSGPSLYRIGENRFVRCWRHSPDCPPETAWRGMT
ncbi:MAG: ABC transporter ATP-binding protein [Syntrophobacteraceae bacterium]